jgi:hypothetical protein
MSKNYKYFFNPLVMSFGIILGGLGVKHDFFDSLGPSPPRVTLQEKQK